MSTTQRAVSTLVLLGVLGGALWANAAGPGPLERVLPYTGRLEVGGQPITGTADLTFELFDDVDEGASQLSWTETHSAVPVSQGAFSVYLGSDQAIPEAAFAAGELYLAVSVDGSRLAGLQRIYPMPAAVRADVAENMTINGDLGVGGNINVTGDLDVTGTVTGLSVTLTACEWLFDDWENAGGTEVGPLRYLDRMNNMTCPANKVLVDWDVAARTSPSVDYRMAFHCCALVAQ